MPASASPPAGGRAAGAADPAAVVVHPRTEPEVAEALAESAAAGRSVLVRGGGSRLEDLPSASPAPAGTVLETRGLAGVIEHHREDLTIEARAGTTLAEIREEIAPRGQSLPLDPPFPDRATLGGVIAAAEPGIRGFPGARPRDLLLGLTAVLEDGARIRSGGRVVKNVTGYELTKLFTGSYGTLGVVTRVVLRLRALPEAARTWLFPLPVEDSPERFTERVLDGLAFAGEPEVAAVVPPGTGLPGFPEEGGFRLALRYEGLAEEADYPVARAAAALGCAAEELTGPAADAFRDGVRDFLPAVPRLRRSLPEGGGDFGLSARGGRAAALRTAWRWAAFGPAMALPDQNRAVAAVPGEALGAALAAAAEEPGVVAALESVPPDWEPFAEAIPPREPPGEVGGGPAVFYPEPPLAARRIMRRLREALAPAGRFHPGPFRWLREAEAAVPAATGAGAAPARRTA